MADGGKGTGKAQRRPGSALPVDIMLGPQGRRAWAGGGLYPSYSKHISRGQ